jgi:CheY-like chemotaxis protein
VGGKKAVIIALTGWGQDEDKRRSAQAGFDHHLVKPVDPAALEKLLAGLRTETGCHGIQQRMDSCLGAHQLTRSDVGKLISHAVEFFAIDPNFRGSDDADADLVAVNSDDRDRDAAIDDDRFTDFSRKNQHRIILPLSLKQAILTSFV